MNTHYNTDTALYVIAAVLTASLTIQEPFTWQQAVQVILAGVIAWKAKRSEGKESASEVPNA